MQLESKHVGIIIGEFNPSFAPPLEDVREIKYCESCRRAFVRSIDEVYFDELGIERRRGATQCESCQHELFVS